MKEEKTKSLSSSSIGQIFNDDDVDEERVLATDVVVLIQSTFTFS